MNLEDRVRAELDRSGRTTKVGVAPSIDELATVANDRRHRNRVLGASGAVVLSSGILFGVFFASQPDTSVVDVANGDMSVEDAAVEEATAPLDIADEDVVDSDAANDGAPVADEVDPVPGDDPGKEPPVAVVKDAEETNEGVLDAGAPPDAGDAATETDVEPDPAPLAYGSALQDDGESVSVQKRQSAVGLASGSGVLVVADGNGGYLGLGLAFGDSTTALSLASPNGLDWSSTGLIGVPSDASASVLREHNGTYVALFERFEASSGVKRFLIGTSTDMVTWEVSAPLAGSEVHATDLAVGSPGVIVIGDDLSPQVWSGPIGGPYVSTGRLDAVMLNGVTTVDDRFVVAGRSRDLGTALFFSTDATEWGVRALGSVQGGDTQAVSANGGTVVLRDRNDRTADTLISSDAGETWSSLASPSGRGVSVSASTMGFLGVDGANGANAVVSVAGGETFSSTRIDVAAPDRLSLVAAGNGEVVLVQTTETGTTWIVASR
jgi:hypothetical protein